MDRLLKPAEAAALLGTTPAALQQWRFHKRQPLDHVNVGRRIFYRESDVQAFIASLTAS